MSETKTNCCDMGSFFKKNPKMKQRFESCMSTAKGDFKFDCSKIMANIKENCCGKKTETK